MNESISSLKSDYEYCQSVIKKYSKSFYYTFSTLPEEDAKAVYAVYAFCRMADDAIDEAKSKTAAVENLNQLKNQLDDFCNGILPDGSMWRALDDVRNRYDLDVSMLYIQLEGQYSDINFVQPSNMVELMEYSKKVAGSVGRLLLPILSNDYSLERQRNAEKLGIAMQITNILRDIGEDFRIHGRVYIPETILNQYGYSLEQLKKEEFNNTFIEMWEHLADEAEFLYDCFREEIIHYKKEARLPLLVSLSVYREILNEVRNNDYDCLSKRNVVPVKRKFEIKNKETKFLNIMESR